ncbi:sensor histidine kinase [Lacticaseibacillus nasuensis]|uniref:sensor histidine kinase n=1 Tax=Lacticaseibacillus nasuensis TaxID=944671 RepID=UPI000B061562|nr:sensor histidine kinase [Lacticaseibacillus nasuensis]
MRVNFRRLMQIYTVVLIVMGMGVTGVGIIISVSSAQAAVKQAENMATQRASDLVTRYQQVTDDLAANITSDPRRLTNISQYFVLSPARYANYAIDQSQGDAPYYYWPNESYSFMMQHPEVQRLIVTIPRATSNQAFIATQQKKEGSVQKLRGNTPDFFSALINPMSATVDGSIGVDYNKHLLDQQLSAIDVKAHLQVLVLNSDHTIVNHFSDASVATSERRQVTKAVTGDTLAKLKGYTVHSKDIGNEFQLLFVVNKKGLQQLLILRVSEIAAIGITLLFLLSVVLWLMFGTYRRQLDTILDTVKAVGNGDIKARVPATVRQADLSELGEGINRMLSDLDDYIYTIYQLRIAQQEANIKALQAQINPHFMSNTLEYIRMAALDADQPELAKVVYSFAALLRNNTDFSPLTTIQKELDFIDKYVFLYQVRFPRRLAYQITVEPSVAALEIPKFSFQPIVENYFVHGVDFARGDNALHIKATRQENRVTITVANNGKPLSAARVSELNARMQQPLGEAQVHSIGLQNVYSRLRDYFGDSFAMWLASDDDGVTTTIQFTVKPQTAPM